MKSVPFFFISITIISTFNGVFAGHYWAGDSAPDLNPNRPGRSTPQPGVPFCKKPYKLIIDEENNTAICQMKAKKLQKKPKSSPTKCDRQGQNCCKKGLQVESKCLSCKSKRKWTYELEMVEETKNRYTCAFSGSKTVEPSCVPGQVLEGTVCV